MIPWIQIDTATMPGGGGEIRLKQRGAEFSIMLGAIELMNSRLSGSEEALATLVAARLAGRPEPRILIGGLGMGFTLRAASGERDGSRLPGNGYSLESGLNLANPPSGNCAAGAAMLLRAAATSETLPPQKPSEPVIPWIQIDTATMPGGGGEIRLKRRGTEFS
ncbi:hypothetical protein, partial [Lysobacter sp. TAB13]|uniref:hypothetical protein n=1 Tax=Lysobacter sp. TAB13 TaxID=3233065 RepID=UPI003F9DA98D